MPLAAVVSAGVDAERHLIEWQVTTNAPLSHAQLLLGLDGPRTPLDLPLPAGTQPLVFKYPIPSDGLHLPPGLNELRYGLDLTGASGELLRVTGVLTSPLLIVDDSVADFQWQEARDGNLSLFYLPGTPAARDIEALRTTAGISLARDSAVLGASLNQPLAIYLLPRIFWQGGATFGDRIIMVSYADRAYTGVGPQDYLTHEIAHALTQSWGNLTNAGGMLSEGIAVYATGGHYQPDRLDRSAATLVQGPLFIPPAILRRDFSNLQHEVAYTESGSFVKYLVDQFGLDNLRALIRRPNDWHALYGADIDVLSQRWLDQLHALPVDELEAQRWRLKVRFFDVLRQYEQRIDPDARRLPSVPVARWDAGLRRALRGPAEAEENQVLELMLGAVIDMIETAPSAEQLSRAAENLDEIESRTGQTPGDDGPAIAEVRSIVRLAQIQSRLSASARLAGSARHVGRVRPSTLCRAISRPGAVSTLMAARSHNARAPGAFGCRRVPDRGPVDGSARIVNAGCGQWRKVGAGVAKHRRHLACDGPLAGVAGSADGTLKAGRNKTRTGRITDPPRCFTD